MEVAPGDFFASDDIALMYNKLVYCIPAIKQNRIFYVTS